MFQFVCNLVRPSSTTMHEHAMSDSGGKASSCCFVAACNRKFIQDLFLELEDALSLNKKTSFAQH